MQERSDELRFMTKDQGVVKAKICKRLPPEERWKNDDVNDLIGLPWNPSGKDKEKNIMFTTSYL